jgi:hypothetical protein
MIGSDAPASNMKCASRSVITRVNSLLCNYDFVNFCTKETLFNAYCTSFYGYQFFDLSVKGLAPLHTAWKKSLRRLFGLHPRTRSKYVDSLLHRPCLRVDLLRRFAKFWTNCCISSNRLVRTCSNLTLHGFSIVDCNVRELFSFCKLNNVYDYASGCSLAACVHRTWSDTCDERTLETVHLIRELCQMKEGSIECILSYVEIVDLLTAVCLE